MASFFMDLSLKMAIYWQFSALSLHIRFMRLTNEGCLTIFNSLALHSQNLMRNLR